MATLDTRQIYNDASTYPDLTILLKKREGYKIDAHRVVLCLRNKVFANLVGKSGTQATSRQLSLWGDVRSLELLIRKIYGFELPQADAESWETWYKLAGVAKDFEEAELLLQAKKNLETAAMNLVDSDEVYTMMGTVQGWDSHLTASLRKHLAVKLLNNERYRADLEKNKALMWEQLDAMVDIPRSATS